MEMGGLTQGVAAVDEEGEEEETAQEGGRAGLFEDQKTLAPKSSKAD
jgi:hypothetical protein